MHWPPVPTRQPRRRPMAPTLTHRSASRAQPILSEDAACMTSSLTVGLVVCDQGARRSPRDVCDSYPRHHSISSHFAGTFTCSAWRPFGPSTCRLRIGCSVCTERPSGPSAYATDSRGTPHAGNPRGALPVGPTARPGRYPRHARRRHQHDQTCSQNETMQHGASLVAIHSPRRSAAPPWAFPVPDSR